MHVEMSRHRRARRAQVYWHGRAERQGKVRECLDREVGTATNSGRRQKTTFRSEEMVASAPRKLRGCRSRDVLTESSTQLAQMEKGGVYWRTDTHGRCVVLVRQVEGKMRDRRTLLDGAAV